jgi:hypothetical protein
VRRTVRRAWRLAQAVYAKLPGRAALLPNSALGNHPAARWAVRRKGRNSEESRDSAGGRLLAIALVFLLPGGYVRSRHYDDWTVESWRLEPRLRPVDADARESDGNPPLWKDVTLAAIIALLLWIAAGMMLT